MSTPYTAWPASTIEVIDLQDETLNPASTATAHLKVYDGDDATWISQIDDRTVDCYAKFNLDSDITGSLTIDTMRMSIRFECHGTYNDDILTLRTQIAEADGTTPLSDNVFICTHDQYSSDGTIHEVQVEMTGLVTDPARWSGNQLWFHWNYNKSKGSDALYISVKQVTISGEYTGDPNKWMDGDNIVQQGEVSQGAVAQTHITVGEHIVQQSAIEQGRAIGVYDLVGENIAQQSAITQGAADQVHGLSGENISQQSAITQGALTQEHNAAGQHVSQQSEVEQAPNLVQYIRVSQMVEIVGVITEHNLLGRHFNQQGEVQESVHTIEHAAQGQDLEQQSAVQISSISQDYLADGQHVSQQSAITQGAVTLVADLVAQHISQQSAIEQASLAREFNLHVLAIAQQSAITQGTVEVIGDSDLNAENISQRSAVQLCAVTQAHNILATHVSQQSEVEESTLGQDGNLITQQIEQQSEMQQGRITSVHPLVAEHISQQSEIEQSTVGIVHNLSGEHVQQQSEVQRGVIIKAGDFVAQQIQQQSEVQRGTLNVTRFLVGQNISDQPAITKGAITSFTPDMKTTTIAYKHPYGQLDWKHRPNGGVTWQDARNLSGYVNGQWDETLVLNTASPEELGHVQCTITNPAGGATLSREAALISAAVIPVFTVHPTPLELEETVNPFFFTKHPEDATMPTADFDFFEHPQDLTVKPI